MYVQLPLQTTKAVFQGNEKAQLTCSGKVYGTEEIQIMTKSNFKVEPFTWENGVGTGLGEVV